MAQLSDILDYFVDLISDTWQACTCVDFEEEPEEVLRSRASSSPLVILLSRFSFAANILPFLGYAKRWRKLMTLLCRKTHMTYKDYEHAWVNVERSSFGDITLLVQLAKNT